MSEEQKALDLIRSVFKEELKPIVERIEKLEKREPIVIPASPSAPTNVQPTALPIKLGEFKFQSMGDELVIHCPGCGNTQFGVKLPVREKVVEKEVEKKVMPKTWAELKAILELPHEDGSKNIFTCPNCSDKFSKWLEEHGWTRKKVK